MTLYTSRRLYMTLYTSRRLYMDPAGYYQEAVYGPCRVLPGRLYDPGYYQGGYMTLGTTWVLPGGPWSTTWVLPGGP